MIIILFQIPVQLLRKSVVRSSLGRQFSFEQNESAAAQKQTPVSGPSFRLSDDQLHIQQAARQFVRTEMMPAAVELDRNGAYPWELVKTAWQRGLMNVHVPEAYGGLGLDCLTGSLLAEEFAFGCAGIETAMKVSEIAVSICFGNAELFKIHLMGLL